MFPNTSQAIIMCQILSIPSSEVSEMSSCFIGEKTGLETLKILPKFKPHYQKTVKLALGPRQTDSTLLTTVRRPQDRILSHVDRNMPIY